MNIKTLHISRECPVTLLKEGAVQAGELQIVRNYANAVKNVGGTVVFGARTFAGNDNEYRYISVLRSTICIEESIKKGLAWVVFEPDNANTWLKAKAMTENFLNVLWRNGALQGAKPENAFYVKVGLGETMTALDISEGRLIIESGIALIRPSEFNIIRLVFKMQEI